MLTCEECGKQVTTDFEAHGWRAYPTAPDEND
jgi:hypothetical protein